MREVCIIVTLLMSVMRLISISGLSLKRQERTSVKITHDGHGFAITRITGIRIGSEKI